VRALRVIVAADREDAATLALWEAGTSGVEVRAAEPGRVELLAYFPGDPCQEELVLALPGAEIRPAAVPEVDWVARFREGFRAFRADRFLVAPAWDAPAPSREVLVVDPGRAFGTGTHETTRLCLGALVALAQRRRLGRTLDLGCGTGLLAAAAVRLGAAPVVASDIDPEATEAARHHARLNGVRLHVVRADAGQAFRAGVFDLVLANLMALLLVDRAAEIRALLAPQAALVVSGLLLDDVPLVRRAFAECGAPQEHVAGEWAALVYDPVSVA
jgi:ribosomal protein L11 methyltransferase